MKRNFAIRYSLFAILAAAWIAAASSLAQDKSDAGPSSFTKSELPVATPAGSLREIVTVPNGGKAVTTPGAVLQHTEYRAYSGPGVDGRGVQVFAPRVTLFDLLCVTGNDDAMGFVGDTRGSIALQCRFVGGVQSKSIIAYTNPSASNRPGPTYGAADGYAGRWIDIHVPGATRLNGGVYVFERCSFDIGPLGAVQSMDSRINFVSCDFIAIINPYPDRPYFYPRLPADVAEQEGRLFDPCGVRVQALVDGKQAASPLTSRLYFANCRLLTFWTWEDSRAWLAGKDVRHDVIAADGPTLCRRIANAADAKAGRTAYGLPGSVPAAVFLKTPN